MNEFLVDIFQLYYLVAMVTKARCTVRNAKLRPSKSFIKTHNYSGNRLIVVFMRLCMYTCDT